MKNELIYLEYYIKDEKVKLLAQEINRLSKEETKQCNQWGQIITVKRLDNFKEEDFQYGWREATLANVLDCLINTDCVIPILNYELFCVKEDNASFEKTLKVRKHEEDEIKEYPISDKEALELLLLLF